MSSIADLKRWQISKMHMTFHRMASADALKPPLGSIPGMIITPHQKPEYVG